MIKVAYLVARLIMFYLCSILFHSYSTEVLKGGYYLSMRIAAASGALEPVSFEDAEG